MDAYADSEIPFSELWGRHRLVIGGVDVTLFRGHVAQVQSVQWLDPWGYGSATFRIPGTSWDDIADWGTGDLAWMNNEGVRVVLERVDGASTSVVWRGFCAKPIPGSPAEGLTLQCMGEATGRLSAALTAARPFQVRKDVGKALFDLTRRAGLRPRPTLGIETGVIIDERNYSGREALSAAAEMMRLAQQDDGSQMTVMPEGVDGLTFRQQWRDPDTIHGTLFVNTKGLTLDLTSDLFERPTTIMGTGRESDGGMWANYVAPLLEDEPAPDFPGTLQIGDSGEDVEVMQFRLMATGFMTRKEALGGYDDETRDAVKEVQERAGLAETGVVNSATWDAIYDVGVTGVSLAQAEALPLWRRSKVRRYIRSAAGMIIGYNPNRDPARVDVMRHIDFGLTKKRRAIRWSRAEGSRLSSAKIWTGTISLGPNVGVWAGEHDHEDTPGSLLSTAECLAGKNILLRGWDGDTLFHVTEHVWQADGSAELTVDTLARGALEVAEIRERNRESRTNPARTWLRQHRAVDVAGLGEWMSEIGGVTRLTYNLPADQWRVIKVIAGDMGQIEKFRLKVTDSVCEFAVAVFAKEVTGAWVADKVGNPFDDNGWDKEKVRDALDRRILLEGWGDKDQPCGYGRKAKSEGGSLSGVFVDEGGFPYRTFADEDDENGGRGVLYVAIYPKQACKLKPQRVFWPAYEVGM